LQQISSLSNPVNFFKDVCEAVEQFSENPWKLRRMLANSSPFKLPVALQRPLGLPLLVLYGTGNWRRFLCAEQWRGVRESTRPGHS
jgi:hypothetical protein